MKLLCYSRWFPQQPHDLYYYYMHLATLTLILFYSGWKEGRRRVEGQQTLKLQLEVQIKKYQKSKEIAIKIR